MTDGARQRSSTAGSAKLDAADAGQESGSGGGGVALKKEIGLVSACGIIVGEYLTARTFRVTQAHTASPATTHAPIATCIWRGFCFVLFCFWAAKRKNTLVGVWGRCDKIDQSVHFREDIPSSDQFRKRQEFGARARVFI